LQTTDYISFTTLSFGECILGVLFIISQTYFINKNYKVLVLSSQNICRFGFMHCFAVNMWMWYRFAQANAALSLITMVANDPAVRQLRRSVPTTLPSNNDTLTNSSLLTVVFYSTHQVGVIETMDSSELVNFGRFAAFLSTCTVQYAAIGAAMMFVFWTRMDPLASALFVDGPTCLGAGNKRIADSVDCSSSRSGFYVGFALFILGVFACGTYAGTKRGAVLLFGSYACLCYCCCILAVLAAIISTTHEEYTNDPRPQHILNAIAQHSLGTIER
ncbi:hypothetical protein PENTCL1PPCAC_14236, partial [Pristionchus entomophagus]